MKTRAKMLAVGIAILALFLGAGAGALHLYMRFANNTQGEMFDGAGHVDLAYCALIFLTTFIPTFGIVIVCGFVVMLPLLFSPRKDV